MHQLTAEPAQAPLFRSNFFRPSNTRINSKSFTATEAPRRGTTPGRQFTRTWSRTWSKSWTVGDDGHTEFRSNSRVVGNPPAEAIATDIANEKAAAPKFVPPPKPPAIQTERHPYRGRSVRSWPALTVALGNCEAI